jgi:hypothetical protein
MDSTRKTWMKRKQCQPYKARDIDGNLVNRDVMILWRSEQFILDINFINLLLRTLTGFSVRELIDHLNNFGERLEPAVGCHVVAILHRLKNNVSDGAFFQRKNERKMCWFFSPVKENKNKLL